LSRPARRRWMHRFMVNIKSTYIFNGLFETWESSKKRENFSKNAVE
jgi:hypothetical protein